MAETNTCQTGQTLLLSSFYVREVLLALDASEVQEVIRAGSVTPVRHAPDQVAGVINLRGKIVTLLDLGIILGFGPTVVTRESRVFIIEDRNEFLGVLVDRVGDVVEVEPGRQEPLPANIPASRARFFLDVWRVAGQVITTLKAPEVLNEAYQAAS